MGKLDVLKKSAADEVAIIASGAPVKPALDAAEALAAEGIAVRVVNCHSIKPLDLETLRQTAQDCGRIVTVEDHTVMGGLGGAICEALADVHPVPVRRLGVQDVFGESGIPEELVAQHGLDAAGITESTRAFVKAATAAV